MKKSVLEELKAKRLSATKAGDGLLIVIAIAVIFWGSIIYWAVS